MQRQFQTAIQVGCLSLFLIACRTTPATGDTNQVVETPSTPSLSTPIVVGDDVEGARLILAFIEAYNAGQLDAALVLLDDRIDVSDCDYEAVKAISFQGKAAVAEWLRQRIADHDQLIVRQIEALGEGGAIAYALRTSDTLRRLGFPDGIQPMAATKVIFAQNENPKRIAVFVNGPIGGDPELCRPGNQWNKPAGHPESSG